MSGHGQRARSTDRLVSGSCPRRGVEGSVHTEVDAPAIDSPERLHRIRVAARASGEAR